MVKATRQSTTGTSSAKKAGRPVQSKANADIDLGSLDRDQLLQIEKDVQQALRTSQKRKRDDALREMQLVAERHGVTLKDLMDGGSKRSVQPPKYRHPENAAATWTGRGRQPGWFKEAIDAGMRRDDLLIS